MLAALIQHVRAYGSRFFHRFGIHCATHQIRVLLICSVVISALLFPAIAIYFSADTHIFAVTLRALDSFLTPDDVSSWFAHHDLRNLWEGYGDLDVREDSVARLRCGWEGILRSERVLVHSVAQDEATGTLTQQTLLSTLKLEQRISDVLSEHGVECLRGHDKRCFSLSPLAFWQHDEGALLSDRNVLETMKSSKNVSVSGLTVTPEMVLAGRESNDPDADDIDMATFLVLTYLFPDSDCLRNVAHVAWLHVLEDAVGSSGDLLMQAQVPHLVALEYPKNSSSAHRRSLLSAFSYMAYTAFLVYFGRSMRRMDTVHSRIGLAFTGIVEIVVSTLTSLSVCAIVGFRVTMVPWEIFPIVVIFIGVENMFSIVDAVMHTSIALPVKMRIAEGLSRAGTSNTLKLISYNTVLGVIAFFSVGAIRQFCAFAIVVLVAHWFLVHTFFVTVLSIDVQRLELDELLRQGAALVPDPHMGSQSKSPKGKLARTAHVFNGRVLKNLSLFLLLTITGALYLLTYSGSKTLHRKPEHRIGLHHPKPRGNHRTAVPESVSPAFNMWQILNPAGHDLVHIRMESPALLVLYEDVDVGEDKLRSDDRDMARFPWFRMWSRTMRPLVWITKIVLVPITVTTATLYGLLLYLLKDADLLETQRNRAERGDEFAEEMVPPVDGHLSFATLPRTFVADVDLVATNRDGSVIVSISLQNELALWKTKNKTWTTLDTSDILLGSGANQQPSAGATLTAVAVDEKGVYCAVGTGGGVIALWTIEGDAVKPLPHLFTDNMVSGVTHIHFAPSTHGQSGQTTPRLSTPQFSTASPKFSGTLYAVYENGSIIKWTMSAFAVPTYIAPSHSASVSKAFLVPIQGEDTVLAAFALDDGTLDIRDIDRPDGLLSQGCTISAGNPADTVSRVHICSIQLESEQHLIVAAATQAGVISLWDGHASECLHILDEPFGDISRLRVTPGSNKVCSTCGELPYENFTLSFSAGQAVLFYRAYLSVPTRRCSCAHNQPNHQLRSSNLGRRSRSSSAASTTNGTATPTHPRSRLSSFSSTTSSFDTAMFPVSGHGVHSRRTSDKDSLRRNLDTFLAVEHDDSDVSSPIGPLDAKDHAFLSSDSRSALWQNLIVTRIGDAMSERGGWEVSGGKIVGIRRKPRIPFMTGRNTTGKDVQSTTTSMQALNRSSAGLSPSALERWEVWTFNPYDSRLEASTLVALGDKGPQSSSIPPSPTTLPPQPLKRLSAGPSSMIITSSSSSVVSAGPIKPAGNSKTPTTSVIPRLHFTRVSPFIGGHAFCVAGFGNTIGVFSFGLCASSRFTSVTPSPSILPRQSLKAS